MRFLDRLLWGPQSRDSRRPAAAEFVPRIKVGRQFGVPAAPFAMCFTPEAVEVLNWTVFKLPAETGAKGFSQSDTLGFEIVEFDVNGSSAGDAAVYRPDAEWGEARRQYHLNQSGHQMRLWTGDIHSHPGDFGTPSRRAGKGLGDLGYVEEVFDANEWMEYFLMPIVTRPGSDEVVIFPWICRRGSPLELFIADLRICPASQFPRQIYNPDWEAALEEPSTRSTAGTWDPVPAGDPWSIAEDDAEDLYWPSMPAAPLDVALLRRQCDGFAVYEEPATDWQQRFRLVHNGMSVSVALGQAFPDEPPSVTIDTPHGPVLLKPVPWARHSLSTPESRLSRLCRWIVKGYYQRF